MKEILTTEESFTKIQAIFDEREREYNAREQEFKQRKAAFLALEEKISRQKEENAVKERELKSEESRLNQLGVELEAQRADVQAMEKELKAAREEFEVEKGKAYLQIKIEKEELKNEQIKVRRLTEQLEYEKEMGNMGVEVLSVDMNDYIRKEELKDYISKSELQEQYIARSQVERDYIPKEVHETELKELKEVNDALQKSKAALFRKMFGKDSDAEEPKEEAAEARTENESVASIVELKEAAGDISETTRDLTADALKDALLERTDFIAPKIRHADNGDMVETEIRDKGLSCFFVFDEPPYFDIIAKRKESKRLTALIEDMRNAHPDITFTHEDGEVRASGYFLRSISVQALLNEVTKIAECFGEKEKRHGSR